MEPEGSFLHNNWLLYPFLSQSNPVQILIQYYFKIIFNNEVNA
jgi:hypothetical protein